MKSFLTLLCSALLLALSLSAQNKKEFTVKIQLENPKSGKILVSERVPDAIQWFSDTLDLKNGQAVYTGKVLSPCLTTFMFHSNSEDFMGAFSIFLDNSPQVIAKGKDIKTLVINGSASNDEYTRIKKSGDEVFNTYSQLRHKKGKAFGNKALVDSLAPLVEKAYNDVFTYLTSIPNYANSEVLPYFISEYFINDTQKLEQALALFSPSLKENIYIKSCYAELSRQKKVEIGKQAYNFNLQDIDEKTYRLSDYLGKYVLVEFSASWCGWCKKEVPFLKQVFNEHKDNPNFVMFTINLDDEREKWIADVNEFNLPWPVISDLKAFKGDVANAYNIHGIPATFLIDPEGKIVEKNLRGDTMIATVRQYLKDMNTFSFEVDGRIESFDGGHAHLYTMPPSNILLDSSIIQNGSYSLKGRLEKSANCLIFIQNSNKSEVTMQSIYIQPGVIGIESKKENNRMTPTYTNAPIQLEINALKKELENLSDYKAYKKINYTIQKEFAKKSNAPKKLKKRQNSAIYKALISLFSGESRDKSEALSFIIWEHLGHLNEMQLNEFYHRFDNSIKDTHYVSLLKEHMDKENKLGLGAYAPDFSAKDLKGSSYTLADFKGKYIFLEFSASWCGWCKKEIPYVRKAYDKLKEKDVVFITMMMDDKRALWESEVKEHNITWLTLSDLEGIRKSKIAKDYNVRGIPASFVIDPNGIIIERDLRGEEVYKKLRKYKTGNKI